VSGDFEEGEMVRRIVVTGALLLAVLGVPRPTQAGLLDFIWEMSGPQMIGVGYGCYYTLGFEREECRIHGVTAMPTTATRRHGPFIVLDTSYFLSTDKGKYDGGQVHMFMIEPGVAFRTIGDTAAQDWRLYHSIGATYDYLFGKDMRGFDKAGIKITPFDLAYKRVAFAFEVRLYPRGFTDDEFGFGPRQTGDRPSEAVYGFKVSLALSRNK
jgi:hypothetical protein